MTKNLFIGVGDIHFKSNYFNRLDDVKATFENKFTQIFELAVKHDVEGVILTGDIFDDKIAQNTTPGFLTWIIKILKKCPMPLYTIVGNHDIRNNDLETIPRQPLGTLFESGAIYRLTNAGGIVGHDFGTDLEATPLDKVDLAVIHAYVSKPGGTMFGNERVWSFADLELLNAKIVLAGHDHQAYPIEKYGSTLIVRPGALFRKNRDAVDLNRPIQVALMDLANGTAEYLPIKHEPSTKVFNLEMKEVDDKIDENIEQFIASLSITSSIKKASLEDEIKKMNLDPKILAIVLDSLDRAKSEE